MVDDLMEFFIDKLLFPACMLVVAGIFFVGIPLLIYQFIHESNRPTFELKKDDWSCTKEYEYTTTTMVLAGKVFVPVIQTHHDCITYQYKGTH